MMSPFVLKNSEKRSREGATSQRLEGDVVRSPFVWTLQCPVCLYNINHTTR